MAPGVFRTGLCVPDSCSDEKVVQSLERRLCKNFNGWVIIIIIIIETFFIIISDSFQNICFNAD